MTLLSQFNFLHGTAFGPTSLAAAAILATAALARNRRTRNMTPVFIRRRLRLPKGVRRWFFIGVLLFVALLALGIDLQGLWSTLVPVLSLVAIGFVAMWSILSHMLASILLLIFRPFELGDRIEIVGDDPILGEVMDLNPVYTTLRAEDGGTLQVPNNLFFQKTLKRHARVQSPGVTESPAAIHRIQSLRELKAIIAPRRQQKRQSTGELE